MDKDKMESILKAHYSKRRDIPERGPDCPSPEELASLACEISEGMWPGKNATEEELLLEEHLKRCPYCLDLLEDAMSHGPRRFRTMPKWLGSGRKEKAKSLNPKHKPRSMNTMIRTKDILWLALSAAFLSASFFYSRFFLQFLVIGALFGLKWIFNKESTRTLITIYNAWKRDDDKGKKELKRIFESRL